MSCPQYVFKILTTQPDLNSTNIEFTELDQRSGFIHLSTGPQIPHTGHRFFSFAETLYILKFPYDKIKENIKWELAPGGEDVFPHLYNDLLTADMDSMREFQKGQRSWVGVLCREPWLFDGAEDK